MGNEDRLRAYLKRVTADARELRRRLDEVEEHESEPIAVIGIACRFPGAVATPEDLWRLVAQETDAISEFPRDRGWDLDGLIDPDPGVTGKSYTRHGGFLDGADGFDAAFFDIAPREALGMDPQQRLLLETSWEAVERAGIRPCELSGSATGVFVGAMTQDYGPRMWRAPEEVAGYLATGNTGSVLSGRVSYTFGLEGPALTIDTGCSSSLVALHLAIRALRHRECSLAFAGGVTVIANPGVFVEFSRQRGLSPDGRCKAFSASADGTGFAEGVGVLLLERLSDARRLGHPIRGVVRGSAVNQDGASNGLTAPNGPAQQQVIRAALHDAQVSADEVDLMEAHGTGTVLGDPIEAQALQATYGRNRSADHPLWLGSVKSNIGHTQAAAGVAGVIKVLMAMRYGRMPRTLHVTAPSGNVDWSAGAVRLLTEARPWERTGSPRRAGVSAFGVGGTNAHVLLEEPGPTAAEDRDEPVVAPAAVAWPISAKSAAALRQQAGRLRHHVAENADATPADVACSLARRGDFAHRAVVVGRDHEELDRGLSVLNGGGLSDRVVRGIAVPGRKVAFVFPGQGSQWPGMARELLATAPPFADSVRDCASALESHVDWSPLDVLSGAPGAPSLERVDVVQPALFTVMVSLARLWRSHGVEPDAVVGHSQGEIAAAYIAGALSLEDAAKVVALRSRALAELAGAGGMAAVSLPATRLAGLLERWSGRLSIAAANGPTATVVAGDPDALEQLLHRLAEDGVRCGRLPVDYASHSPQVERIRSELLRLTADVRAAAAGVPIYSAVTGDVLDLGALTPEYWYRNLRSTVRFDDVVRKLLDAEHRALVEVSPHPVLTAAIEETAEDHGVDDAVVVETLRRDDGGLSRFLLSVSRAQVHGVPVDWDAALNGARARRVDLPTYPFQHERYWLTDGTPEERPEPDPADSRYRITWKEVGTGSQRLFGTWLVVRTSAADAREWADEAEGALRANGADVTALVLDGARTDRTELSAVLANKFRDERPAGILSLLSFARDPHPGHPALSTGTALTLTLVQALADVDARVPLWVATSGAVAVHDSETIGDPEDARLWGLGIVAALEHHEWWGGLVDLPRTAERIPPELWAAVLAAPGGEDQVALRPSGLFARRLVRDDAVRRSWSSGRPGGVLITGGAGAAGAEVARWFAAQGAEHLVLTCDRDGEVADLVAELTARGPQVTVVTRDSADRAGFAEQVVRFRATTPVRTVVHAATHTCLTPLVGLALDDFAEAVAHRTQEAAELDALFPDADDFVVFSSVTGVWGAKDHAADAAANAHLDALAERRRHRGLAGSSVAWGVWADAAGTAGRAVSRQGLPALSTRSVHAALDRIFPRLNASTTVADIRWERFLPVFTTFRRCRLFDEIPETHQPDCAAEDPGSSSLFAEISRLPSADRERKLLDFVVAQVAEVLGYASAASVRSESTFKELGITSLTAVDLRNRIREAGGLGLPVTLVFDHPTPAALAAHLAAAQTGTATEPASPDRADPDEPIAIVGMACRFPGGVASPEDLWRLVSEGVDAISPAPSDRGWDLRGLRFPDGAQGYAGGFLPDVDGFDAAFFGISPREAVAMDPQQRLLLEVSWEAVERAGIDPAALRGSRTGVFIGTNGQDYVNLVVNEESKGDGFLATGNAASVMSGRLSYTYGLEGPSLTLDTACSSSLSALHLACQALRQDECRLAFAGGVTVMATPESLSEFSRQGVLAPDGRCKAFSANADGAGFAEGVGLVLLERLSDARRNGREVLAVVRGSAVNQDGASNGLTAPNGPSQQRVIQAALASGGLSPADIDAVEGHGTGTVLGDLVEVQALMAAYGRNRAEEQPLWLGSLKSNIGHTQAAAGIAGVIKSVMSMRHGTVPRTLHVAQPLTTVDWSAGRMRLAAEPVPWPETGRPRRAAVSSFGMSGTNAHVVIEHIPHDVNASDRCEDEPRALPWPISAHGDDALHAQAARLREHVEAHPELTTADVGWSLATRRGTLERRAVVIARGRDEFIGALAKVDEAGGQSANVVRGGAPTTGKVVFVFPGQGTQWPRMARELMRDSAVFARGIRACEQALERHVDWSLTAVLDGEPGAAPLDRVDVVQPVLFSVMVSLAEMWRSHGVHPAAVVGHSQGEVAAACVAGALSLEDAAKVIALRSRALREVVGRGAMASIALPPDQVRTVAAGQGEGISIAAVNSPRSTVVAGDSAAVDRLLAQLARDGVRTHRVQVDYASHSPQVEPVRANLEAVLAGIRPAASGTSFYSTVEGRPIATGELDAGYWYRNLRSEVRFDRTVRRLLDDGFDVFLEVSPHPVLVTGIQETVEDVQADNVVVLGSLRRDEGTGRRFLRSVAEAHVHGVAVDWEPAFAGMDPRPAPLPTYAFQRRRFWVKPDSPPTHRDAAEATFWNAVEREDLEAVAETLGVDPEQRETLNRALPMLSTWRRRRHEQDIIGRWRYRVGWKPVTGPRESRLTGEWLLVRPPGEGIDAWARQVRAHTDEVSELVVHPGEVERTALASELAELRGRHLTGVVSLLALDEQPHDTFPLVRGLTGTAVLVQALGDAGLEVPLWCVTSGAVKVGETDAPVSPAQAGTWGLGLVAALEHPDLWGGLIDMVGPDAMRWLGAVVTGAEDQVAVRVSGLWARRLVSAGRGVPRSWRPRGTVLVTGGTGALGARVARWLAEHGADHLVLASRRGAGAPGAARLRAELERAGAQVTLAACDVGDRAALSDLLNELRERDSRLRAVVHTAGSLRIAPLSETTVADFARVASAKVGGAMLLDELLRGEDLDAFVLFSSNAGVWGGGGQGAYAAANAYLDALALRRRAHGETATSVSWGLWAGGGMGGEEADEELLRRGVVAMEPQRALAALHHAIEQDDDHVAIADIDWDRFVPAYTSGGRRPLISDLPGARRLLAAPTTTGTARSRALVEELSDRSAAGQRGVLVELVRTIAAAVLGHDDVDGIAHTRPFRDLGVDSLRAVELRDRLSSATGLRLATTLVFDHPTPAALAEHLRHALLGSEGERHRGAEQRRTARCDDSGDPLAIVAMACRFPGGIASPEDLWRVVESGADVIGAFPRDRGWDLAGLHASDPDRPGTCYVREGGFLHDAGMFDPELFGISPREARSMDPQQRLLLETAWEAFERAGLDPTALRGSRTAVFVGATYQDYGSVVRRDRESKEGHLLTGNSSSVMSGRVAYTFGLVGPAITVDTACSSSLVALHLAGDALRRGECSLALVGSAAVMATPAAFVEFSRQRGLAPDGRCKSFADTADGTAWSEGAGAILLERLSDARRNGHPVLAIVRGTAVNQDGASNGLTAPSGLAQQDVIRAALANAGLAPAEVDAVEGHGTGTPLGDPIEAQAVLATYGRQRPADQPLWLGSLKSNIGHAQAAAGIAGMVKTVMALRHALLPRSIHLGEPTRQVDWSAGHVRLVTDSRPWPQTGRPRRAGVSSFGISGTNAHVILEQAPDEDPRPREDRSNRSVLPWLLSAKTPRALRAQGARLLSFVEGNPDLDLADVGLSLASSRAGLEHRAAVVGTKRDCFLRGLSALVGDESAPEVHEDVVVEGGVAFLFPGQGAEWPGMGRELYAAFPVFATAVDEVVCALDADIAADLREAMFGEARDLLERTVFAQAALFAVEVGSFRLLESWGVVPDFVLGHSVGELAAAHVSGALSLTDAARLVSARGRLMQARLPAGAMVALRATPDDVLPLLDERVSLAAVNGPSSVVISGDEDAVAELVDRCTARGWRHRRLSTAHAFHSPHVDLMEDDFEEVASDLSVAEPAIPLVSGTTGEPVGVRELRRPGHWCRQARDTVRFYDGVRWLSAQGVRTFMELGPDSVLSAMGAECVEDRTRSAFIPIMRSGRDAEHTTARAVAQLHNRGVGVDWRAVFRGTGAREADLPTYAFQRQPYWAGVPVEREAREAEEPGGELYRCDWVPISDNGVVEPSSWAFVGSCPEGWATAVGGTDYPDRTSLCRAVDTGTDVPQFVVVGVAAATEDDRAEGAHSAAHEVLELVQWWLGDSRWDSSRLVVVTDGATGTGLAHAPVWGLVRSAQAEHPDRFVLVDRDSGTTAPEGLFRAVASGEKEVVVRGEEVVVPSWIPVAPPVSPASTDLSGGTVLVTGGTGVLGSCVARFLVERWGVGSLVLASRRGPDAPGASDLVVALESSGARVRVVSCDVGSREEVADLVASVPSGWPLRGVVHAAGTTEDGVISGAGPDVVPRVFRAKVTGAWWLHQATAELDLAFFVFFSSAAGVLGSGGQGIYAGANAFLDGLARFRRYRGLPGQSLAWGLWEQRSGLTERLSRVDDERLARSGVLPLSTEEGLRLFDAARAIDEPVLMPIRTNAGLSAERADIGAAGSGDLARRLASQTPDQRYHTLLRLVGAEVATVLALPTAEAVDPQQAFADLGFDSMMAVELRNRLSATTGVRLRATVVFDHPTAGDLAAHLRSELEPDAARPAAHTAVLGRLDQLETALSELTPDDDGHTAITARLKRLLTVWTGTGKQPAGGSPQLDSATDDEVFTLLGRDFGIS
ncbi:hypothetical protein ALI22I_04505 [Saccharothrix sp. ALI-22-I]|uniref:type I polyketide synthase n=1 Tax=Saccharothrix sp. ALI-22-I TaxID=1933778 RepID=UPI00097BD7F8|nr:type I polyketide synthase [Saccharothrix sp. ALI-22-I]ONI92325.1 hypothetical protein ALI22I_04505 [Saccharothrix sp. ALI-22-I]